MPPTDDRVHILHGSFKELKRVRPSVQWKDDIQQHQPLFSFEETTDLDDDDETVPIRNQTNDNNRAQQTQYSQRQKSSRLPIRHKRFHTAAVMNALKRRAFHLPGNVTWWEDWRQYIANTHPLLAIIGCSHDHHPESYVHRWFKASSSIFCSITISIGALLWSDYDVYMQQTLLRMSLSTNLSSLQEESSSEDDVVVDFPRYVIYLWTWMSALHAVHDLLIWYSCSCHASSSLGAYLIWLSTWIFTGTILMYLLASDAIHLETIVPSLLVNIAIELLLSWLIWYPLVATLLFSGVLGCFRVPILGGRRQELHSSAQARQRKRNLPAPMKSMKSLSNYDNV